MLQRTDKMVAFPPVQIGEPVMPCYAQFLPVVRVRMIGATGLLAADRGGTSDPYVKVRVGGGGGVLQTTKVVPKTLSPVWDQTFDFRVQRAPFTLHLALFDHDRIGKHDPLGEVTVDLIADFQLGAAGSTSGKRSLRLSTQGLVEVEVTALTPLAMPPEPPLSPGGGDTTYLPTRHDAADVELMVIQGVGLRAADPDGLSDPYVTVRTVNFSMSKATESVDPRVVTKIKSSVQMKTLNPYWVFRALVTLRTTGDMVELIVKDQDRVRDDTLGCVKLTAPEIIANARQTQQVLKYPLTRLTSITGRLEFAAEPEGYLMVGFRAVSNLQCHLPTAPTVPGIFLNVVAGKAGLKKKDKKAGKKH